MKTIKELNEKIWYRALKVFYTLVFVIATIIGNFIFFTSTPLKSIDLKNTTITCNYWDKKSFSPASKNISLDNYDFNNYRFDYKYFFENYNSYTIKDILETCSGKELATGIDIFALQKLYESRLDNNEEHLPKEINFIPDETMKEITKIENTILDTDKSKYLDYSTRFFEIKPKFTMHIFLRYFLLINLVIYSLFIGFKKAFYYIALGTLTPKK